ncbi:uncharacterized protein JCM6883_003755 [Sporobolomyces salmoneus]|uniref:uncharacterized protein n=1 Tax=Sporobolomyces salmoneus TaxID=183962 RepID=UPI0031800852
MTTQTYSFPAEYLPWPSRDPTSSHFSTTSSSRALYLSPWFSRVECVYPCDDCLPLTPPTSSSPLAAKDFTRSSRRSGPAPHESTPFPNSQQAKFVETSGLASYRFPNGLPTPASSRPNSPTPPHSKLPQSPTSFNRDLSSHGKRRHLEKDEEEEEDERENEDEDEEEFRERMLKRRRLEEFDGDMEGWEQSRDEGVNERSGDEKEEERN